jgi:hypothetical protein
MTQEAEEVSMRALFRFGLALVALGMTLVGCNKSNTSGPPENGSNEGSAGASSEVTCIVPGMS